MMRRLRHWKQRYDPNAAFVCRRPLTWDGQTYQPGDRIPDGLSANQGKLRRFWETGWIELAEFAAPDVATGQPHQPTSPEGVSVARRGSWYILTLPDGSERKAQGQGERDALLAEL